MDRKVRSITALAQLSPQAGATARLGKGLAGAMEVMGRLASCSGIRSLRLALDISALGSAMESIVSKSCEIESRAWTRFNQEEELSPASLLTSLAWATRIRERV
jgi:hypothetical protein